MRESIFFSSLRAFFISLFVLLGFCAGFVILLIAVSALGGTDKSSIDRTFTPEIVANADNVRKIQSDTAPVILQLNIEGVIGTELFTMNTVRNQLIESREGDLKNNRVKGILLRINSPGGTVTDSNAIYQAIKWYKKEYQVPVYAYVDGLCASGGMMVACAADKIFANEASSIGSVGVIIPALFNVTQLMEKIGIQSLTVFAGKNKDDLNPFRPWKQDEDQMIKDLVNYHYDQFVDIVVTNRPQIKRDDLVDRFGADVYNPVRAQEYGFIDGISTRSEVLKLLLAELKIEDDKYQVVELTKHTWFSELYSLSSNLVQGKIVHQIQLPAEYDMKLMNQFLYLYRAGS